MRERWGGKSGNFLRKSSNRGTGDDHLFQLSGANRFSIFIPPRSRTKGYQELLLKLESAGCVVTYPSKSLDVLRELPGEMFKAINIECEAGIQKEALEAAHRWAHQRDLLHSFFVPF